MQNTKFGTQVMLALIGLFLLVPVLGAGDQTPMPQHFAIGKVTMSSGKFSYAGSIIRLSAGVHMTSMNYEIQAQTIDAYLARGATNTPGASSLVKATAEGDPAKGTQVYGQFENIEQAEQIKLYGDHAVYTPDASRMNGGTIHFTGHVRMFVSDAQALAEPAPMTADQMTADQITVLLGQGVDYPKVGGDNLHAVLTPLQ